MRHLYLYIVILFMVVPNEAWGNSLNELLQKTYDNNPAIKASMSWHEAEKSLVVAKGTLEDPMVGVSTLNRGNETTYGVITQKLRFPVKYYLQAKAQKNRAEAQRAQAISVKYEVRQKVVGLYYSIFSMQKVIQLTEANKQAVKEFSRVAERKYSAGKAPQGDSMKAHFELTGLELDLIRFKQQEEALQAELKSIVNDEGFVKLKFGTTELAAPKYDLQPLNLSLEKLGEMLQEKAPKIQSEVFKLKESEWKSSLSKWEYAPDIQFQYQKRLSGLPEDSDIFSVSLSVPLWFWKKGSEASAASAAKTAQEYRVKSSTDALLAKINDLRGKVEAGRQTLRIYKTSLIPQAQGAYNSSKAAYRANKTSFLDLLDSERSLFKVKTGYYQSLQHYAGHLSLLEAELGFTISNFENQKRGAK